MFTFLTRINITNILVTLVAACACFHGFNVKKLYTKNELEKYGVVNGSTPILLGIGGKVYDVSIGSNKYGKDGYSFFLGRDASKAFVTGDFTNDLHDGVEDFSSDQLKEILGWQSYYDKTYPYKGRVVGSFYNRLGMSTPLLKRALSARKEAARPAATAGAGSGAVSCNSRWQQDVGGEVSCDGGLLPRLLRQGDQVRCVCTGAGTWSGDMELYPGCESDASRCKVA